MGRFRGLNEKANEFLITGASENFKFPVFIIPLPHEEADLTISEI